MSSALVCVCVHMPLCACVCLCVCVCVPFLSPSFLKAVFSPNVKMLTCALRFLLGEALAPIGLSLTHTLTHTLFLSLSLTTCHTLFDTNQMLSLTLSHSYSLTHTLFSLSLEEDSEDEYKEANKSVRELYQSIRYTKKVLRTHSNLHTYTLDSPLIHILIHIHFDSSHTRIYTSTHMHTLTAGNRRRHDTKKLKKLLAM